MVTSKGNKQCKKASVVETSPQHDIDPADTPLGKRFSYFCHLHGQAKTLM